MLWTIVSIIVMLWLLLVSASAGILIHLLLVVALAFLVIKLVSEKRPDSIFLVFRSLTSGHRHVPDDQRSRARPKIEITPR
jgi:hypothetical protein